MAQQSEAGSDTPVNNAQTGQQGFSASSLLDMNSLPPWLREGGQEPQDRRAGPSPSTGPTPSMQTNSTWQPGGPSPAQSSMQPAPWQGGPPAQSAPTNNAFASGGGLAASSFIDMNSLPDWLRSAAGQPTGARSQQPAPMGNPAADSYGIPPRVENVHVPSRPRGEMSLSEGSEVAASVFASMLGVASTAPNFPAPQQPQVPPLPPSMANVPNAPMSGQLPPQQAISPMGGMPGQMQQGMPQGPGMMGAQPPQGYAPGGYGGYQGGGQGYYPMGNPSLGVSQVSAHPPGPSPMPGAPGMIHRQNAEARPAAKRGLFNAIREWLMR